MGWWRQWPHKLVSFFKVSNIINTSILARFWSVSHGGHQLNAVPPEALFWWSADYLQISVVVYNATPLFRWICFFFFCLSEAGVCWGYSTCLPDRHSDCDDSIPFARGCFCNKFSFVFLSVVVGVLTYFRCSCSAIDVPYDTYKDEIDRSRPWLCW